MIDKMQQKHILQAVADNAIRYWKNDFMKQTVTELIDTITDLESRLADALAECFRHEHAKLCPMCSIFPSEKSGCIRLAELRRAADVAEAPLSGEGENNAKEE